MLVDKGLSVPDAAAIATYMLRAHYTSSIDLEVEKDEEWTSEMHHELC